jgi:two-component system cell cycle sensor histidine kinase/response regulator CckA
MKRVLLVDDEDSLRRFLKKVLQRAGRFEVVEASTSADALAFAQSNHFDVLVTDVFLDEVNGPSLAHFIVERQPSMLVVFMSGYPFDIEAEQRRLPNCAFLRKPFPPQILVTTIQDLGAKSRDEQ